MADRNRKQMPRRASDRVGVVRILPVLGLLVLSGGCGDSRLATYPATGRVLFADGTPVRTGMVECRSREHSICARGVIGRDGSFKLGTYSQQDGAVAGEHDAIVVQMLAADSMASDTALSPIQHNHGHVVSLKHADYRTSGLRARIVPGEKNFVTLVVDLHVE